MGNRALLTSDRAMPDPHAPTDAERRLETDLHALEPDLWDDQLAAELYRGLTNRTWRRGDEPEQAVALSWNRAERLVNELRGRIGYAPLTLVQTGQDGELTERVRTRLEALGWRSKPLDTSTHQDHHAAEPASTPPAGHGEEHAPQAGDRRWSNVAEGDDARSGRAPRS
ncbi:MAG: hypothetical protein M3N16_06440 [Actinomycetota bacterium]|nr:hypothetical protein [Actinomycetota bacterium]